MCALSACNELTDTHLLQIQRCTKEDEELQKLIKIIKRGWPDEKPKVDEEIRCYWDVRGELTVNFGMVWKDCRIVIPKSLRREMLKKIHSSHLGLEKCKLRARETVFWPHMNAHLQDYLSNCQACLTYRKQNTKESLMPHEVPDRPWYKVGTDVFHFNGQSYIMVIDYYSKYVEIAKLSCLTSETIINKIKHIFRRHGIPEIVMSDNGPEFASNSFREFARNWNFQHTTSSPRYPQSNGQVERAIQTVKNIMRKTKYDQSDLNIALLEYLNTPISHEIPSPAELMYNRKLRSIVPCSPDLLRPNVQTEITKKLNSRQQQQKINYDKRAKQLKNLSIGQKVKVRIDNRWVPGVVKGLSGPRSYLIAMETGNILRRNRKHLIADSQTRDESSLTSTSMSGQYDDIVVGNNNTIQSPPEPCPASAPAPPPPPPPPPPLPQTPSILPSVDVDSSAPLITQPTASNTSNNNQSNYTTRSGRTVKPPDRWGYPIPSNRRM